jgi:pyruvate kinase
MESVDEIIKESIGMALDLKYVNKGDLVVIAAGVPVGLTGTTNMLKAPIVGDILVKGTGMAERPIYGRAAVIGRKKNFASDINDGDIIVVSKLHKDYIPLLDRIGGVISEEGGFTSHLAVECITRGVPVITGAEGAAELIKNGMIITMDAARGLVFSGKANIF